jgi:hypothetical protein
MPALPFSIASGWLLVSLFAVTSLLPWAIARNPAAGFRWHFSIGRAMAPIALLHSWPAMSNGWTMRAGQAGIYAASLALLMLFAQAGLGLRLRGSRGLDRRRLRRVHFGAMAILAGLIGVHVGFNSVLGSWLRS